MAMTNVGIAPQFNEPNIRVEPYLLDFDRDIYGQKLSVDFVKRLRDEAKFDTLDALIQQIHADVEQGRELLSAMA
jgi:riboflavin kinase/FMN adenylyltransferase